MKTMVMLKMNPLANGNVGNVITSDSMIQNFTSIKEGVPTIPTIPTIPFGDKLWFKKL